MRFEFIIMRPFYILLLSLISLAFVSGKEKKTILRGEEVHADINIEDHKKCLEYIYEYDIVPVDSVSHKETDKLLHIIVLNKDSLKQGMTYEPGKSKNIYVDYSTFVHLNRCWYKKVQGTIKVLKMQPKDHLTLQINLSACRNDTSASEKIIDKVIKW